MPIVLVETKNTQTQEYTVFILFIIIHSAYGEFDSCLRYLAKDDNSFPMLQKKNFMSPNNYPEGNPDYHLYVFYIHHHQGFSSAQPIRVRFDFRPAVPAETILVGFALLLTNILVSANSAGQRQFDLVLLIFFNFFL